jgi:hypothetical protein
MVMCFISGETALQKIKCREVRLKVSRSLEMLLIVLMRNIYSRGD